MNQLLSAIELYDMQLSAVRDVLHAHPLGAASWYLPEMSTSMANGCLDMCSAHTCRFGMASHRGHESARVKIPTGLITNAECFRNSATKPCTSDHIFLYVSDAPNRAHEGRTPPRSAQEGHNGELQVHGKLELPHQPRPKRVEIRRSVAALLSCLAQRAGEFTRDALGTVRVSLDQQAELLCVS